MSWTDPIPANSNWWEFVPVFDGKQQKQESVLRKYVDDWGYGVVSGNVMKRSKHPHCSWAVKNALDEWDDVFSSKGTPPLKPLSKQELEHLEGSDATGPAAVVEEGGGGGGQEPDSLNVSAIEQVNESSSRARTTARQVLAKGFSPTVAEGLSHARGRESLGHDPTGRLSYGGIRRVTLGGGGGGGRLTLFPLKALGNLQARKWVCIPQEQTRCIPFIESQMANYTTLTITARSKRQTNAMWRH